MLSPQFDIYERVSAIVSGNVADIGSGTGFGTHLFARNAFQVDGYEIDKTAVRFSQKAFSNGNISFYQGDITEDITELLYDFVVMIDVIEHIPNDKLAIQNCRKILRGTFICSTPNKLSRYRKSENHVREYTPETLRNLVESVFKNVDIVDYQLQPIKSEYENPIIAICE